MTQPTGRADIKCCSRCKLHLALSEFGANRSKKNGLQSYCIPCGRAARREDYVTNQERYKSKAREWRLENPDRVRSVDRAWKLLKRYNLTEEQRIEMLDRQGGLCGNTQCGEPATDIDHNHDTSVVRALLCNPCNRSLGALGEDIDRIIGLAEYAEAHA